MYSSIDALWVLIGGVLVFFMQAGFAMVETGFTRAKNAGNIIMKNLMDFAIGSIAYWVIGFGLMFASPNGFIGGFDPLVTKDYSFLGLSVPDPVFFIFQTMFCATAATIVSGAMAERTKFISYCVYSLVISAVIYPVQGHWIWGGGWLASLGFHDFAGSTAVHMVGGIAALVGAKMVGPRIGKYSKDGKARAIPGHSLTLGALGVFILWFAWFGFNGASSLSMTGDDGISLVGNVFVNTNLAAAVAATTVMIITWIRFKKPDVSMTLNGALAGLVAITAGCDAVSPVGAFFIGLIAAFVVVFGIEFIDKILKIDDPVGAIGVHCLCGATGTILTGLFAVDGGLFYGGGFKFLGVQMLGVITVAAWVGVTMFLVFFVLKKTIGLRVSAQEEIQGLDIHEHGIANSYADFMPMPQSSVSEPEKAPLPQASTAIPVTDYTQGNDPDRKNKMTKIIIVTNQSRFEQLKSALEKIGITGMTVSNVHGFGMQKGHTEYYRGIPLETRLLPKIKVETVICKIPVETAIKTIKEALYTGNIGDGKIFVCDVENVVKIRTGEEGCDALQDAT